jgi:hypothetical protein
LRLVGDACRTIIHLNRYTLGWHVVGPWRWW